LCTAAGQDVVYAVEDEAVRAAFSSPVLANPLEATTFNPFEVQVDTQYGDGHGGIEEDTVAAAAEVIQGLNGISKAGDNLRNIVSVRLM
jgi:hypothetical protein